MHVFCARSAALCLCSVVLAAFPEPSRQLPNLPAAGPDRCSTSLGSAGSSLLSFELNSAEPGAKLCLTSWQESFRLRRSWAAPPLTSGCAPQAWRPILPTGYLHLFAYHCICLVDEAAICNVSASTATRCPWKQPQAWMEDIRKGVALD